MVCFELFFLPQECLADLLFFQLYETKGMGTEGAHLI